MQVVVQPMRTDFKAMEPMPFKLSVPTPEVWKGDENPKIRLSDIVLLSQGKLTNRLFFIDVDGTKNLTIELGEKPSVDSAEIILSVKGSGGTLELPAEFQWLGDLEPSDYYHLEFTWSGQAWSVARLEPGDAVPAVVR